MHVPFEKHVLANGLELILHEDHESPLVTVYVAYHVGSSREEPGRTGFAHLFEHVMFEGSKHVPEGEHFRLVQEAGGTLNGNTNVDRTVYFETLPASELELALWLESDRMGFLLDALSQATLDNQRDVVKEERRQNYENRPYGIAVEVLARELHPPGHPYSWATIGSMADLEAASLDDVRQFFRRFYGPNNATVAIGGDIDPRAALELARRYFEPLPRGPLVPRPAPRPFALEAEQRVVVEDRVAVTELTMIWPTPCAGHPDGAALEVLTRVLSQNRSSLLDRALTIDEELAAMVTMASRALELSGSLRVVLRPHEGVSLDRLHARTLEVLRELARDGVDPAQFARVRASHEAEVLRSHERASARTRALAESNVRHGDPERFARELERRLAVAPAEIVSALRRHLLQRPHLALSVVPEGRPELALTGSRPPREAAPTPTPAAPLDVPARAARPAPRPPAGYKTPPIWREELASGLALLGTDGGPLPLTRVELDLAAGRAHEPRAACGLASLVAALLDEGTASRTSTELQEALDALGATLMVHSDADELRLRANVLDAHRAELLALIGELLREPRFERAELERARNERLVALRSRAQSARGLAADAWPAVVYGPDSRRGAPPFGTLDSVAAITLDDVRAFWSARAHPDAARALVVGAVKPAAARALLEQSLDGWSGHAAPTEAIDEPARDDAARVLLLDRPGAPQCELRVGHEGLAATHPDWFPLTVLNFVFGGCFSSRLNRNLREDKGYTYGARSSIGGGLAGSPFTCHAAVRTEVAAAAVREVLDEFERLLEGPTETELRFAREALPRSQALQYDSGWARVDLLHRVGAYGWPERYPEERREELSALTAEDLRAQAARHVHPERARVLVVGDARELRGPLEALGRGPVALIDARGRALESAV